MDGIDRLHGKCHKTLNIADNYSHILIPSYSGESWQKSFRSS